MRILLLSLILFTSCKTMNYGKPATDEDLTLEEIIEIPGESQSELYIKCNEWFVNSFGSAEDVIQFQDKEAGKIMGKFTSQVRLSVYNYLCRTTISIDVKDEKVRVIFSDPMQKLITDNFGNRYNHGYQPLRNKDGMMKLQSTWLVTFRS